MGEINTRGAIRTKISSFPAGNDSECLTKSEILSQGRQDAYVGGSYGNIECAMIDDVKRVSGTYSGNYSFDNSDGSESNAIVAVNNGVATINLADIWYEWVFLGDINLKANIESGVLKNVISCETSNSNTLFIDLSSGVINGALCQLTFVISAGGYVFQMVFTGTKQ